MKVIITGKNGYVANQISNWLKKEAPEITVLSLDMRNPEWMNLSFSDIDVIIHTAALVHKKETKYSYEEYEKINVELTDKLAIKGKAEGVKQFIFFSTMAVYGTNPSCFKKIEITEKTLLNPKTKYGKSKLEAEQHLKSLGDDRYAVCILRPPIIYGPHCPGNYNGLRKLTLKAPILPLIKNKKSMLYIDSLCEIIVELIRQKSSGIYFPQNNEYVCTTDMAQTIAYYNGKKKLKSHLIGCAICIASLMLSSLRKAFGTEYYAESMKKQLDDLFERGGKSRKKCSYYSLKMEDTVFATEKSKGAEEKQI